MNGVTLKVSGHQLFDGDSCSYRESLKTARVEGNLNLVSFPLFVFFPVFVFIVALVLLSSSSSFSSTSSSDVLFVCYHICLISRLVNAVCDFFRPHSPPVLRRSPQGLRFLLQLRLLLRQDDSVTSQDRSESVYMAVSPPLPPESF